MSDLNIVQANPFGIRTVGRVQTEGEIDFVKNNSLYRGASAESVMVTSEDDLSNLDVYTPGSIAFTAGFKKMWQLSADGAWVDILEEDKEDG